MNLPPIPFPVRAALWLRAHAAPLILGIIALIGAALFISALIENWTGAPTKQAEARLDGNVAQAAQQSGAEAVNTVQTNTIRETTIERTVDHAQAAVAAAPDAAAADAAGRDGLCAISTNLCPAASMQRADP
jgi:hypothetical protein